MTGFLLGSALGLVVGLPGARWLQVRWAGFGHEAADPCAACPLLPLCERLVPFPSERG
ncbi:hypothetical protein [Kutzneria sp. CA-103260]|uniref:hypothetical protein n=1 Tax=Kutzneria sp. CA-103260 TaxID=2802641 RepID=UPI001BA98E5C|nr:hypothetical protein [Kutzneria sp. CA-103260]QUQ70443.1 hypothetical protein JJ691_82220 [Kutzneria sp. CA-103260]